MDPSTCLGVLLVVLAPTTTLDLLSTPDRDALAGSRAELSRVRVFRVGPTTAWVGPSQRQQLLVVPDDATMLRGLGAGDVVIVEGSVVELPESVERARRELGLGDNVSDAEIRQARVYIRASSIEPLNPRVEPPR